MWASVRPPPAQISAHWSSASSSVSGCPGEKIEPNCWRKKRSLESREKSGPDGAAEKALAERGTGGVLDHRAVQQQGAGDLHLERALEVAGHQLGRDRGAHVMGDDEDRLGLAWRRTSSSTISACQCSV